MSLPVLLRRFPWGLPAPDRNTRLIMASLALFLLLWIPLVFLGFDPDSSAAPLWQHAWFHASMWLFLASSFLLAWKGLSFLEFRLRLPASLTFLPLLLVWYLVEWHWSGSPMRLEEPRLFYIYTMAWASSMMVMVHLLFVRGIFVIAVAAAWGALRLEWDWLFRLPGPSRLLSAPLSNPSGFRAMLGLHSPE